PRHACGHGGTPGGRGGHDRRGQPVARGLAHTGTHRWTAFLPLRESPPLGRQYFPRRLRRRDRRPPWKQHPRLHFVAQANSVERRRMAPSEPRTRLPQGRRPPSADDRPAGRVSPYGRLWHLRHRLAPDGRMGERVAFGEATRLAAALISTSLLASAERRQSVCNGCSSFSLNSPCTTSDNYCTRPSRRLRTTAIPEGGNIMHRCFAIVVA